MVNMAGFSNSVFMLDFRWFLPTLAQISSFLFKNSIKVKVGNALMADISDGFSSSWYNPVNPAAITPSEVSFCLHKLIQILDPEKNNHFSSSLWRLHNFKVNMWHLRRKKTKIHLKESFNITITSENLDTYLHEKPMAQKM